MRNFNAKLVREYGHAVAGCIVESVSKYDLLAKEEIDGKDISDAHKYLINHTSGKAPKYMIFRGMVKEMRSSYRVPGALEVKETGKFHFKRMPSVVIHGTNGHDRESRRELSPYRPKEHSSLVHRLKSPIRSRIESH